MGADKTLVDVHFHLAAFPTPANGCYVSPRLLRRPMSRLVLRRLKLDPQDPEGSNQRYVEQLVAYVRNSRCTRQVVLLALDGVCGPDGVIDRERTHFLISNELLFQVCRQHQECLPGASINPLRRDALDELDRCAAEGAVLVKWLPNAQDFDPADRRCRPFYRRLVEHRLPLLSHSGCEFTLVGADQSLGDPGRLLLALDEGVTVISAHAGSTGLFLWEKYRGTILHLLHRYSNYYLDSSALCSPNRVGMALAIRHMPEVQARLLYGSDYPVPVVAGTFLFQLGLAQTLRLGQEKNPLDKNVEIQRRLGYRFADLPAGTRLHERAIAVVRANAGDVARQAVS